MVANENVILTEKQLQKKQDKLEKLFSNMIEVLGFDRTEDQNLANTPKRMAKMYVRELMKGCFTEMPAVTIFENSKNIDSMVVLGPIRVHSLCSHHMVPFLGQAWVGYIPDQKITGISKLARIVDWFSRRPQIQEELTEQISSFIEEKLEPLGVGVYIKAQHGCMQIRGIQEPESFMTTTSLRGVFMKGEVKEEFLGYIK